MIVESIGPSSDPPFVPSYLVSGGKVVVRPDASPGPRADLELPAPLVVPDGSWIGVRSDGTFELFPSGLEGPWRAAEAQRCMAAAMSLYSRDAIRAAGLLHSAASLVGLSIPELVSSIDAKRAPGETLDQAFERIRRSKR